MRSVPHIQHSSRIPKNHLLVNIGVFEWSFSVYSCNKPTMTLLWLIQLRECGTQLKLSILYKAGPAGNITTRGPKEADALSTSTSTDSIYLFVVWSHIVSTKLGVKSGIYFNANAGLFCYLTLPTRPEQQELRISRHLIWCELLRGWLPFIRWCWSPMLPLWPCQGKC